MNIPPEVIIAATFAIVSFLGAIAAVFKFLPPYLQKRIDLSLKERETEIKIETDKTASDIKGQDALYQLMLAMSGTLTAQSNNLTAQSNNLDALTKAVVNGQAIHSNNTNKIEANTLALQVLVTTIDRMDKTLVSIDTDRTLEKVIAKAMEQRLETLITQGNQVYTHIQVFLRDAEAKLQDVKKSTGETPTVGDPA